MLDTEIIALVTSALIVALVAILGISISVDIDELKKTIRKEYEARIAMENEKKELNELIDEAKLILDELTEMHNATFKNDENAGTTYGERLAQFLGEDPDPNAPEDFIKFETIRSPEKGKEENDET